jgi:ComF family protein
MFAFRKILLDILFPKYCVNCGHEGGWLCFCCAEKIIPVVSQVCSECEKLSPSGKYHKKCSEGKALAGIISSAYFDDGPTREMIHNFKYNSVTELAEPLSKMMVNALEKSEIRILKSEQNLQNTNSQFEIRHSDFVITFVPLHWKRQARRGYNQSEILAKVIGRKLNIKVEDLLSKKQSTKRQALLRGNARRMNLHDVFTLKSGTNIKNKKIIIVDDIATTGSTLNECAKVLKKNYAKEIWGLVVARG